MAAPLYAKVMLHKDTVQQHVVAVVLFTDWRCSKPEGTSFKSTEQFVEWALSMEWNMRPISVNTLELTHN